MLQDEKKRTYVFLDVPLNREIHIGLNTAAGYFNQGARTRMRYIRSYIPKVTKTTKMRRSEGDRKIAYDKISEYEETDVQTILPSFAAAMIKHHKAPKTWLSAGAQELPEPPEGFNR